MVEKQEIIDNWKKKLGRKFYRSDQQAILRLALYEWGWDRYFHELIQLLASNNLLVETQKFIPIQIKKWIEDEEYGEE